MSEIRQAQPAEGTAILRLWAELLAFHRLVQSTRPRRLAGPLEPLLRSLIEQGWSAPDREAAFVAIAGEEVVGFVRVVLEAEGPCPAQIEALYVDPAHRGLGLGRDLIEAACGWARERGEDEISVDFIAPNTGARGLYEHLGLQPLLVTYMQRLT